MAEAYGGLVGAFVFAWRRSRSWLFRSYVLVSAAVGGYVSLVLLLGMVNWLASPVVFGERALLGVIGLLVLVPLFGPVLVTARRHRRSTTSAAADRWLALGGYGFLVAVLLALFVSDPSTHRVEGPLAPVAAWLDGLPDSTWLVPPVVATALLVALVRLSRPAAD